MRVASRALSLALVLLPLVGVRADEVILPKGRHAYYAAEAVELAVADVKDQAVVELVPQKPGAVAIKIVVAKGGRTAAYGLPAYALAPNVYTIKLNGKDVGKLTISTGVHRSTMLLSQTSTRAPEGGANFIVSNAASFGLIDGKGLPLVEVRGKQSPGMSSLEQAVLADLPLLIYHYWTGYVLHKPFGDEKSWAAPKMNEAMRLLNFHVAQHLRHIGPGVLSVGPIDEPGLAWGKTPAGGMASGFPLWLEKPWYEARGWTYTQDPARRPADDWMKYLRIRTNIIKENYDQARKDIKTVWPEAVFGGDLYAPLAIMDGTDPFNQRANDLPTSHVFFDFTGGPMAVPGQIYLEKSHDPTAPIAHAMNGQLIGVAPKNSRPLYHLLMNSMLQAGLASNWWLNTGAMSKDDLAAVNDPAERLGPLFRGLAPRQHDLALLWSYTEIGMRAKDVVAREASKKTGEQIKLLVPYPDEGATKQASIETSPYEVGAVYTRQVMDVHQILRRAGYPAHVVHERLLPEGALKKYRTLVLVGQTFDFPSDVRKALDDFVKGGGIILRDRSTTIKLPGAIEYAGAFGAADVRARSVRAEHKAKAAKTKREESRYTTSQYVNEFHRQAVGPLKAALAKTKSRPVFVSTDADLGGERHVGGDAALWMVVNGHEKYPDGPESGKLPTYNYAPARTTFTLQGVPKGSVVHVIEGLDWRKVSKLADPQAPITADFAAGEMKLYLVVPRDPAGLDLSAQTAAGVLHVGATLKGLKAPWPFTLTVTAPDGREVYRLYRATGADGAYREALPLGVNAHPGVYAVRASSPIAKLTALAKVNVGSQAPQATAFTEAARVFDEKAIRRFLAARPVVTIAYGKADQKPLADDLAAKLSAQGIKATARSAAGLLRKVAYPRVWDPYARLVKPTGAEKKPGGPVKQQVTVSTLPSGEVVVKTAEGKTLTDWRMPATQITVGAGGLLEWLAPHEHAYEPGCKLYVDPKGQRTVLRGEETLVPTTDEFRARWAKPWQRLMHHVGGFQLPPELPEAYRADDHLILLGDSRSNEAAAVLQASELLPQIVDVKYPGPGRALVSFAWSPFAVEKNVILVGATDTDGLRAGITRLLTLTRP